MISQMRAEFLKLKYSSIFKAMPVLFVVGMVLYITFSLSGSGTQLLVSEGDEEINTSLHGIIGFFAFTFENLATPQFDEILQSVISCNVFLWIFILILVVQFFNYDYNFGTIKLPIANGISRLKIFFAKVFTIFVYAAIFYLMFSLLAFVYTCVYVDYMPSSFELLRFLEFIGLNFLVMVTFILICIIISIFLKNIGIIATVMCVFTLGGAIIYTGIWQQFHSYAILRYLIQLNPFYYWMNMGTLRLDYGIKNEIIIYFLIGMLIFLPIGAMLIRKQEVK